MSIVQLRISLPRRLKTTSKRELSRTSKKPTIELAPFAKVPWAFQRTTREFFFARQCYLQVVVLPCLFFPQIAGSYRGSYFSMIGLLIPKIAKWSPFWVALGCRCRLVSLHLSPFMISIRHLTVKCGHLKGEGLDLKSKLVQKAVI